MDGAMEGPGARWSASRLRVPLFPPRVAVFLAALVANLACFETPAFERAPELRPSSAPLPRIDSIAPPSADPAGSETIRIGGSNFRQGARVWIGGAPANVLSVAEDEIRAVSPGGLPGSALVVVANADSTYERLEEGLTFAGTATAPRIDGTCLAAGPSAGGGRFQVRGANFLAGAEVLVGGVPASEVAVLHGALIEATAPPGPVGTASVSVRHPGGATASLPEGFRYVDLSGDRTLVQGRAEYEKRQVLPEGLTGSAAPAPIPYASMAVYVDTEPVGIFPSETDRWGYFCVVVEDGPSARVRVTASARVPPALQSVVVMDNATDRVLYCLESDGFSLSPGETVRRDLLALCEGPARVAGAFNILSVCARCASTVQETTGEVLPLLRAVWEPGNAVYLGTSAFYHDDLGAGPVPVIQILGGLAGGEELTDTDEFDDSVVAHEFGHFCQASLSTDSSPGGSHGGENLVPNLAFSEGFANWFACAMTGTPWYRDTAGRGVWGLVQVEFSCESVDWQLPLVMGIRSEETVLEMLWDLYDGSPEAVDEDGDGMALGSKALLDAVASFDPSFDYPCLYTLLDALVERNDATPAELDELSRFPEEQDVPYPVPPGSAFPRPLEKGVPRRGFVDARNPWHPPDPSWKFWLLSTKGNPYNPVNGTHSRRYYRFVLDQPADVSLTLSIDGDGDAPEDLDLFLLDLRNHVIALSMGDARQERIETRLASGAYIVEVRGFYYLAGGGVRTSASGYTLLRD